MKTLVLSVTSTLLKLFFLPSILADAPANDSCSSSFTTITKTITVSSTSSSSSSSLQPSPTDRGFTIIAAHSTSPIHLQPIQASGEHFFISNGGPSSYCPVPPLSPGQCPPGTSTVFNAANGGASLAVEVPGGQQIYVAATGALSYTPPHSHAIPSDAALGPFTYTAPTPAGNNLGHFGFTGLGATGFVACPVGSNTVGPPWQVFADVAGWDWGRCIGFDALASTYQGLGGEFGAWEYT